MENPMLKIELPLNVWNVVLNAIASRPFGEVHEIINMINTQAKEQLGEIKEAAPAE